MLINILLLLFDLPLAWLSIKPVHLSLWPEKCYKKSLALNDCNWCHCGITSRYECTARICDRVDMFGHFNDAITQLDVGMEGKGVWRSTDTVCEPGVHYRKDEILCICDEDGSWPSAVCRDTFQVLHLVEPTKYKRPANQSCTPNKLYQIDCNVCYCLSSGVINSDICTKRNCSKDVVESKKQLKTFTQSERDNLPVEVYAVCVRGQFYKIGCQTCMCLPNNRLFCDNCTEIILNKSSFKDAFKFKAVDNNKKNSLCFGSEPGKPYKIKCNICQCDKSDTIYCTVLKCLKLDSKISIPHLNFQKVDAPIDDTSCIPVTKYKKDCNVCHCFMLDGVKYFGCTVKMCHNDQQSNFMANVSYNCIEGTKYEKNCLICQCITENGVKREICTFNDQCKLEDPKFPKNVPRSLESMHGYCEPLHTYHLGCNKCKCLNNGQIVACTSKICSTTEKPIVVEFVPIVQKQELCPSGHSYKVNCNICYCLSNGNTLCTTNRCKTNKLNLLGDY